MKRTVPLLITAVVGFIFIVSFFTPAAEFLGELAAIWFDILAGIAFVLGGGNLLKVHLKKISDRRAGWGYSAVTLVAFLATLTAGLVKLGSPPAANQEFYGETFAPLLLEDFPESQVARVDGELPQKRNRRPLPSSVRRQVSQRNGKIEFRGWMHPNQKHDLAVYKDSRKWRAVVDALCDRAQPPGSLKQKIYYYVDHSALSFRGAMTDAERDTLLSMTDNVKWRQAVEQIAAQSLVVTRVGVEKLPPKFQIPGMLRDTVSYNAETQELAIKGPMSAAQRDALTQQFPLVGPISDGERQHLRREIESRGDVLTASQLQAFSKILEEPATAKLTIGQRNKKLGLALLSHDLLNKAQRDFLFAPCRDEAAWRAVVNRLFFAAHVVKYPWSGEYRSQGNPFWWLYEYAFKPLTATMFALLAFYVASAAFRAFRAKNVEAILLLVTAFVILLGRTFAGVVLTDWLPDDLAGLKIDNLTVYIMQVFNTAGNRAIMIGIALGIASTSLKVLLGVDRSYLGSGEK